VVHALPAHGLKAGGVGTVVLLHGDRGFEVELMRFGGDTVAGVTVSTDEVRPLGQDEIAHARRMNAAS